MSRFLELMQQTPALPDQGPARFDFHRPDQLFPQVVAQSPFHIWSPRDPIAQTGTRILLGVATWSGYDMVLLDQLDASLARRNGAPLRIDLFNAGEIKSMSDFRQYIPELPDFVQTPVVGIWQDGRLVQSAAGYEATDLVAKMFGISADEIVAVVDEARSARAS